MEDQVRADKTVGCLLSEILNELKSIHQLLESKTMTIGPVRISIPEGMYASQFHEEFRSYIHTEIEKYMRKTYNECLQAIVD